MPNFIDLRGKRFGKFKVLERVENKGTRICWNCRCDCGREKVIIGGHLVAGTIQSCGCFRTEKLALLRTTHGKHSTREYRDWQDAKNRCYNPNIKGFKNWGGRGIIMSPVWRNNFHQFYSDMGPCSPGLTIERINN